MKEKEKKIDSQLCPYITAELKQRNIAYKMKHCGPYSIIRLNMPSAAWNELVKTARYRMITERDTDDQTCYLPVVSIHTLKSGRSMRNLQAMFHTHCFFIKDEQWETVKYMYA